MQYFVQYRSCPGKNIWSADNPVEFWTSVYHQKSSVCTTTINLGLKINAGMFMRWLIFDGPLIKFISCQVRTNETSSETKRKFSVGNREVLKNAQSIISGDPLVSLSSSARVRRFLRLLGGGGVDWYASRLVRLIYCQILLTAISPVRLLTYRPLAIHLLVLQPVPLGRVKIGFSC